MSTGAEKSEPEIADALAETAGAAAAVAGAVGAGDAAPPASVPAPEKAALDLAEAEKVLALPQLLKAISERYEKPLQKIVTEIARLSFGRGKVATEEYFTLRLFDDANIVGEKSAFAGMKGMRDVWIEANYNSHWFGPMSDKLAFDTLIGGFGLPVIRTRAYYSADQNVRSLNMLRTPEALSAFLKDPASYPFFGKPKSSSLSLGSASAVAYEAEGDLVRLQNGKSIPLAQLVREIVANFGSGYLFQERVKPHEGVRAICGERIATVRLYTLNGKSGPKVFRGVWKIPAGRNMADNFWRKGNILAAFDYESGAITRAITGFALDQKELSHHPDTGHPLVGAVIPNFEEVVALALDGARVFSEIPLIGWDIAPTDEGGVIVEGNFAPDFKLVQMAERRGILDAELAAFLEESRAAHKAHKAESKRKIKEFARDDMKKFVKGSGLRKKA
ncbi:MAG: sugar-transfer associated ATP-grasp domain-containing protein [Hyphomicrobiaceae bacterium]